MPVEEGQILEGKVTGVMKFGAFVALPEGESGLIHISEISDSYVESIDDFIKKDDTVKVRVLERRNGKISLSMRKAQEKPKAPRREREPRRPQAPVYAELSFEDKMSRYLKESNERHEQIRQRSNKRAAGNRPRKKVHA